MQIGTLLHVAEISTKNTHFTYTVAPPAQQNTQFWRYCLITHLNREIVAQSPQMRDRVDLNT